MVIGLDTVRPQGTLLLCTWIKHVDSKHWKQTS